MDVVRRVLREGLKRFRSDHRGQAAITFALAAIPMLVVTGAAVDYSRSAAQHSNLQQASDSTVLAIAHSYVAGTTTVASLMQPTQTYLSGAMNGATLTSLTLSNNNTLICISTTFTLPTTLMAIVNYQTMTVHSSACAAPPSSSTFEVALALDNSGSMASSSGSVSKIAALQTAAQQLVDILNPAGTTKPATAISIVPFTALVNVGTSKTAAFLDTKGTSSIHWQNFHRPAATLLAPYYPKTKFDLFASLQTASWGGCVEERPAPYITTDTAPSTTTPDTLFVPFLSPDDPGNTDESSCFYVNPLTQAVSTSCNNVGSGAMNSHYFYNSYLYDTGAVNVTASCVLNPLSILADTTPNLIDSQPNYFPLGGATMVCKYNGGKVVSVNQGTGVTTGPNFLCSSQQLTPLTTDRSALTSSISSMAAGGSTNLATGFMWAWRSISPIVAPFPVASPGAIGSQNPKAYSSASNQKFIILMTDGFNSWTGNPYSPFLSTYEAFGYYVNNRIAAYGDCNNSNYTVATTATSYRCQMDNVTLEACANAKKAGITIYTVGFTVASDPIDAQGISLLRSCASSTGNFYQASDGAGIVAAFQQIAQNIQGLRLTQ